MPRDDRENVCPGLTLKCPECKRLLQIPRTRLDEGKPLICGGCGQRFDCHDLSNAVPDPEV